MSIDVDLSFTGKDFNVGSCIFRSVELKYKIDFRIPYQNNSGNGVINATATGTTKYMFKKN